MHNILNDLQYPCDRCKGAGGLCRSCNGSGCVLFRPNCGINVDMDGVLADFCGHYQSVFGKHPKDIPDKEMWENVNSNEEYWWHIPVLPGAVQFMESIRYLGPTILTACPASNYHIAAMQKKSWCRKHLPGNPIVLPTNSGLAKPLFMHMVGDILIDDYGVNIKAWEAAGGVGVKHEGDFEATRARLIEILIEKHKNRQ